MFQVNPEPFFESTQNKTDQFIVVGLLGDITAYKGKRIIQDSHKYVEQYERNKHGEGKEIEGSEEPVGHPQGVVLVFA